MLIGLAGTAPRVGKSTVANYLRDKHDFVYAEMSLPIQIVCAELFGVDCRDYVDDPDKRALLQSVGATGKKIHSEFWLYHALYCLKTIVRVSKSKLDGGPDLEDFELLSFNEWADFKRSVINNGVEDTVGYRRLAISGIRAPGEADEIRKLGGTVYLVENKRVVTGYDAVVECELLHYDRFSGSIPNNGTFDELYENVNKSMPHIFCEV